MANMMKEKLKNMASSVKAKVKVCTAGAQGKKEKLTARNHEEKEIAVDRAKAKEFQAKADLHREKAEHSAEAAAARYRVPVNGPHQHHGQATGAGKHL